MRQGYERRITSLTRLSMLLLGLFSLPVFSTENKPVDLIHGLFFIVIESRRLYSSAADPAITSMSSVVICV